MEKSGHSVALGVFMSFFNKKNRFAILVAGFAFLFGCSDSSSPSNPLPEGSEDISSDSNDSPVSSSVYTIPGTIVGNSSASGALPFDVSTLPGVYTASANLNYNVSGIAEFGPFQKGATVSVYGLDSSSMKISPMAVNSAVSSDQGNFSSQGTITSNYANIVVSGSYFNLFTQDKANITLNAVMNMQGRTSANVNILTRLAYDRIVYLVAKDSVPFSKAKVQAEKEIQAALGLIYDKTPFENINISTDGQAGANLIIAIFALTLEDNPSDAASNIATIAADIAADGTWDDASLKTKIADSLYKQNLFSLVNITKNATGNSNIKVKGLGPINFWAYQYGLGECTVENDGAIATNTNTLSRKNGTTFLCKDSSWQEVSAALLYSNEVAAELGECNSSTNGTTGKYKEDDVICKQNYWQKMSDEEKINAEVSQKEGDCSESNNLAIVNIESSYYQCNASMWKKLDKTPVDYSKGRTMNKKLGRGINFGNSWESEGSNDCGWSNCIQDGWFKTAKDAGFNSIRLPVRWENDAAYDGTLNSSRLAGVKADIDLALAQGLVVIVNAHHHNKLNDAAANYSTNPGSYNTEKQKFLNMWKNIATAMNSYGDDKVVLEILNEPHGIQMAQVNDLMTSAYQVIRQNAPGKTIMFESAGYSKFAQIPSLDLPADGNIIVSGHYYDPYTFTHQGHDYDYNANASFSETTIENDFKSYAESIAAAFPDINGGCVPINMGEFGVASTNGGSGISETKRAQWTEAVIQQAEKYGFSWHYWGFAGVGGFEAYNKGSNSWYSEIKAVFDKYLSNPSTVK